MSDFDFKEPCLKCGNSTLNRCLTCGNPLCNRCKSRKAIIIPLSNNTIPKGICQTCKEKLLIEGSIQSGIEFHNLLRNLIGNE